MSGHTPGPWSVGISYPPRIIAPNNRGGAHSVSVAGVHQPKCDWGLEGMARNGRGHRNPEVQANARLIAAAPELLAALEEAVNLLVEHAGAHPSIDDSAAAIAKARGEA